MYFSGVGILFIRVEHMENMGGRKLEVALGRRKAKEG